MFRVIARGLLARKFRLFATALAVTLGVAFMAGTMVLTDTIGNTFNNLSAGVYKGTDAEVRAKVAFSGPMMGGADQRRTDPVPAPGPRSRRRRGQRNGVCEAHREQWQGARQPGGRRAHPGRQ